MTLIKGFTNTQLGYKIDVEGLEYFFRNYVSADSILDPDLRAAVEKFNAALNEIEGILDEAGVFDDETDGHEAEEDC